MDFGRICQTQGPPLRFAIFMNFDHFGSRIQTLLRWVCRISTKPPGAHLADRWSRSRRGLWAGIPFRMDFGRIRETQGTPLCFAIFMNFDQFRSRIQTLLRRVWRISTKPPGAHLAGPGGGWGTPWGSGPGSHFGWILYISVKHKIPPLHFTTFMISDEFRSAM